MKKVFKLCMLYLRTTSNVSFYYEVYGLPKYNSNIKLPENCMNRGILLTLQIF